jgi:hypothetical protein
MSGVTGNNKLKFGMFQKGCTIIFFSKDCLLKFGVKVGFE